MTQTDKFKNMPSQMKPFSCLRVSACFFIFCFLWLITNENSVFAYETDNFTARDMLEFAPDATPVLNQMAQKRIQNAIQHYQGYQESCEVDLDRHRPLLLDEVEDQFKGYFSVTDTTFTRATFSTGLENEAEINTSFQGYLHGPRSVVSDLVSTLQNKYNQLMFGQSLALNSIYDGVQWFVTFVGLQQSVNISHNMIGLDKIGHFFSSGLTYFDSAYELREPNLEYSFMPQDELKPQLSLIRANPGTKKPFRKISYLLNSTRLRAAIQIGINEEENFYGLKVSGVKSYADMSAEFQGLRFWTNLLMGPAPYVVCEQGKYKMNPKRKFDFHDYFHAGLDEGINCSEFSPSIERTVRSRIDALGGCPIIKEQEKCEWIAKLPCAEFNTSPRCLAKIAPRKINTFCEVNADTLLTPILQQSYDSASRVGYLSPQSRVRLEKLIHQNGKHFKLDSIFDSL